MIPIAILVPRLSFPGSLPSFISHRLFYYTCEKKLDRESGNEANQLLYWLISLFFNSYKIHIFLPTGSAQIRCYTVPSVAGELNCFTNTPNFEAATIEECCLENPGFFFEDTTTDGSCTACIGMERYMYQTFITGSQPVAGHA